MKPLRVGFDAHMLGERETGNETYALGLLYGLNRIGFAVDAYVVRSEAGGIHRSHRVWPGVSLLRIPISNPLLALRDGLQIWHGTYVIPPALPCKAVVTVHDVTFALHPEWFAPTTRHILSTLVPRALRSAARIVTISESTKRDIAEMFGVSPDRISVTYLAPRPRVEAAGPDPYLVKAPFFLYVGTLTPRKSVSTAVRSLALLRERGLDAPLMVVGPSGAETRQLRNLVSRLGLDSLVTFTGYLPESRIAELYSSCTALLHPALYEGFGLTLVEAMARGAPIIAADTSSIPEVVADAGILLPALDVDAWSEAMERVLCEPTFRVELGSRSSRRARLFSWERCARQTVAAYRAALAG